MFLSKLLNLNRYEYYPIFHPAIDLRNRLPRTNLNKMTALYVGAGSGDSALGMQLPYIKFQRLDFIDIHEPYLESASCRTYAANKTNFIKADVRDFDFSPYDIILIFDVLEHLPKEDSLKVIDKIKCKLVVFLPLEREFRENVFGAESQDHLSLWTEQDFKNKGFKTDVLEDFHPGPKGRFPALWALRN
jgi:hypothetical protein